MASAEISCYNCSFHCHWGVLHCFCVACILSNYAAESYRRVWTTLWPPTRIQSLLKFVILCVLWCSTCLKVAAFFFFFFQNWLMFIHLIEWKQYAVNWGNKHAFLLCQEHQVQCKSCIRTVWNCNTLSNKYSIQSSNLVGTSTKWKRQCVLYLHACHRGNSVEMSVVNIFSFILTGNIWSWSLRWEKWLHCHWWHPGSELPLW